MTKIAISDRKLIKQLEEETGIKLKKYDFEDIRKEKKNGYTINNTGEVFVIAFYRVKLNSLPQSLGHFKALENLILYKVEAPDYSLIQEMKQLSFLDLSENKIKDISFLTGLRHLVYLDLWGNRITDISPLRELTLLTTLNLSCNPIIDILPLRELTLLTDLYLSSNLISDISPLRELTLLVRLFLYSTQVIDISPLRELTQLRDLDLSYNQISDISPLRELTLLTYLYLVSNPISDISPLRELNQLTYLSLGDNQISDISPLRKLNQLTYLSLGDNQISDISPIRGLTQLKDLYLGSNQIIDIPPLRELNQLTYLSLGDNQIIDISPLREVTQLTHLSLDSNQISDISPLRKVTQLKDLYLGDNQISDISPLRKLTQLTHLSLDSNQIIDISPLRGLTQLKDLYLGANQIIDISPLKALKNLSTLDIRNNNVRRLHRSFTYGMYIEWDAGPNWGMNLYGNPLESPPVEIVKQGTAAVRNYFEQLDLGSRMLLESKLLIVGSGEVGKTTLMRKLLDNKFIVKPGEEETTHGIHIKPWTISCSLENDSQPCRDVNLSIWDFGGQAIYHATHQFFLTKRSLYLFVWEPRKEEDTGPFDYWLNVIKLLSANSPVIVVMNKADLRKKPIDEASYKNAFPNIVDFIQVSCLTGTGIDRLTDMIRNALCGMRHLNDELPSSWLDIRTPLKQEGKNYIDRSRYYKICDKAGMEPYIGDVVGDYLHDLGTILHFQQDPVLKDTVIINPEWATEAVYKLIDTKDIIDNKGRVSLHMLPHIWDPNQYPSDKHPSLMRLMEKFELCFRVVDTDEYIIPQLVPAKRPDIDSNKFSSPGTLRLQYRYVFMPAGIVSRFIARNHYLIPDEKFWQNGVELVYEESSALLLGDPVKRLLTVSVTGPQGSELLHIIRNQLQYIHSTLNMSLDAGHYFEEVPCNCAPCSTSAEPNLYPFAMLKNMTAKNQPVMCYKSCEMLPPALMLKGFQPPKPAATLRETLLDLLKGFQSRAGHMPDEEDSRTAFLAQLLTVRGYHVNEQAPRGRSEKGSDMGRLDMEIRSEEGKPLAILEAFNLEGFKRDVIERHVQKIFSYDENGLPENVILVYVESADFNGLWQKYVHFLSQLQYPYPLTGEIEEHRTDLTEIKCARTRHLRNGGETALLHLFVNLFERPRRKSK
ncbi:MAG: leucine-rich repeat domain-containing protein [Candidatus Omnitrophota bacterium]